MNFQVSVVSLHSPHPLPVQEGASPDYSVCSDETTAGSALGRLAGRGSRQGEAQIPQADKTGCKHPARGGGRGQATRWQEKEGTGGPA